MIRLRLPRKLTPTLSKRIFKATLATLICFALCLIDAVSSRVGHAIYLLPLVSVSMNPGRRVGQMIEAVILSLSGLVLGLAYSILGRYAYLRLYNPDHESWSLGTLAAFEVVMLGAVGFIRGISPRLFIFSFLIFVTVHFSFLAALDVPLGTAAKEFSAPSALSIGICFAINVLVFPEFGSTYIGINMVDLIHQIRDHLGDTVHCFIAVGDIDRERKVGQKEDRNEPAPTCSLESLLEKARDQRKLIYSTLTSCKAALTETSFEITYGYVSPIRLKSLHKQMGEMSASASALVNACETRAADAKSRKMNDDVVNNNSNPETIEQKLEDEEAEPGDMRDGNSQIQFQRDVQVLVGTLMDCLTVAAEAVAYAYDIDSQQHGITGMWKRFRSNSKIDHDHVELCKMAETQLLSAFEEFDSHLQADSRSLFNELQKSDLWAGGVGTGIGGHFFLVSSFILNLRVVATTGLEAIRTAGQLAEYRRNRDQRKRTLFSGRRLWFFSLSRKSIWKYLGTGSKTEGKEIDVSADSELLKRERMISSDQQKKLISDDDRDGGTANENNDQENISSVKICGQPREHRRKHLWMVSNEKMESVLIFTFKYMVLLMAVSFPAFVTYMRQWYQDIYGVWVGYVANLVFETSIGGTALFVLIRGFGLLIGSTFGYAGYEASRFNAVGGDVVMCVILVPLFLVGFYVQLATPYPKAAMIGIVSSTVVILSTTNPTVPGTILENYAKRLIAMAIGGGAAVAVQVGIFPTRARWLLIRKAEAAICIVDSMLADYQDKRTSTHKWNLVIKNLTLATTYLNLAKKEPRLKQSYKQVALVWKDMIQTIQQLADRIRNCCLLENFHNTIEPLGMTNFEKIPALIELHRETLACIDLGFEAVRIAICLKRPVPHFLPSARAAHIRQMIAENDYVLNDPATDVKWAFRWSARRVALSQVIESLERLIELTRELMGTNAFQHGFLAEKSTTTERIEQIEPSEFVLRRMSTRMSTGGIKRTLSQIN